MSLPLSNSRGNNERTGNLHSTITHIVSTVIGSGMLCLPWAITCLGWIAGPLMMMLFSIITYYTSHMLSMCYRIGNHRNGSYIDAIRLYLGLFDAIICGLILYIYLFGVAVEYTILSAVSIKNIIESSFLHFAERKYDSSISIMPFVIVFGAIQIFLSQFPNFSKKKWFPYISLLMVFIYSSIGLGLALAKFLATRTIEGSIHGPSTGSGTGKMWKSFQSLGIIAFAYSYSTTLMEIQDTIRSPRFTTMQKANIISLVVTTLFYSLFGFFGYASFGDNTPSNFLNAFMFGDYFWLVNIAYIAIVIHLMLEYQGSCHPLFSFIETRAAQWFPQTKFVTKEFQIPIPGMLTPFELNIFRLIWRTLFVCVATYLSIRFPFFEVVVGLLGALSFFPLTVYFPMKMYIEREMIQRWSSRWKAMQLLCLVCFIVSILAIAASIKDVVMLLKIPSKHHA